VLKFTLGENQGLKGGLGPRGSLGLIRAPILKLGSPSPFRIGIFSPFGKNQRERLLFGEGLFPFQTKKGVEIWALI